MKYPDLTKHLTTPSENNSLLTELLLVEYFCSPSPIGTQGSFGFGLYEYKPVALQYYVFCGYMMEKGSLDALQQDVFIYLVWKEKKWNTSWFLFFTCVHKKYSYTCILLPITKVRRSYRIVDNSDVDNGVIDLNIRIMVLINAFYAK